MPSVIYSFNQLFIPRMQEIYLWCSSLQPQYPHVMCNERIFLIELKKKHCNDLDLSLYLKSKIFKKKSSIFIF